MSTSGDGTGDADDGSSDSLLRELARTDDRTPSERVPGRRVGRFIIEGELGRGGMGVVYRARDPALGRTVALKVLPSEDAERRARFLREARSAGSLEHPNIVTIFEVGEFDERLYIAMALVPGGSLRARLGAAPALTVVETVSIVKGIARALAAAHALGVVHRDLKPENVMLDADGEPVILDFGLAKLRDLEDTPRALLEEQPTDSPSTEEGRLLGTPAYMSPEQAAGKAVDARSDLFSLGVLAYEALAGVRPFVGESPVETMAAVLRDTPAPLRKLRPDVPEELADLITACLAKAPADRPASATQLLHALSGLRAPADDRTGHAQSNDRQPVVPTRTRSRLAAFGVLGLLGAGVLVAAITRPATPAATSLPSASAFAATNVPVPPTSMTAVPLPSSTSTEALAAYRKGVQSLHDADRGRAQEELDRALKLDPMLGAASVRLCGFDGRTRAPHCENARQLRGTLSERDTAIVDARARTEATGDLQEMERLVALARRYPGDAEIALLAAAALKEAGQADDAKAAYVHVMQLDPKFALALLLRAAATQTSELANADMEACLQINPGAPSCLRLLGRLRAHAGDCVAYENLTAQNLASEPRSLYALSKRLDVMLATGMGRPEVAAIVEAFPTNLPPEEDDRRIIEARLSIHFGEFQRALVLLGQENQHGDLLLLASEMGDARAEAKEARAVIAANRVSSQLVYGTDAEALAIDVVRRLDGISVAAARSTFVPWLDHPGGNTHEPDALWSLAALDGALATSSTALRARLDSQPPTMQPISNYGALATLGRTALAAGFLEKAEELLGIAARACTVYGPYTGPNAYFSRVHARLDLGEALARKGDVAGACASFGQVVAQWGNAKPRSTTAEKAKARMKELRCRP